MNTSEAVKTISEAQKQKAAAFLQANPVAQMVGMKLVDIAPGEAVISFEMRDQLRQPHGILHGGITATLIDTAMAFGCYRTDRRRKSFDDRPDNTLSAAAHRRDGDLHGKGRPSR